MRIAELVLDNSVLSAFRTATWFRDIGFWRDEYALKTSERVWELEFQSSHPGTTEPSWLDVEQVEVPGSDERPVSIGEADWSLVRLARECTSPVLVTNDAALRDAAEAEGIEPMWGTKFLIDTFESCGISRASYRDHLEGYVRDVYLNPDAEDAVKSAEKPQ